MHFAKGGIYTGALPFHHAASFVSCRGSCFPFIQNTPFTGSLYPEPSFDPRFPAFMTLFQACVASERSLSIIEYLPMPMRCIHDGGCGVEIYASPLASLLSPSQLLMHRSAPISLLRPDRIKIADEGEDVAHQYSFQNPSRPAP